MNNTFLIEAFQTPPSVAENLIPYFEDLPQDQYVTQHNRYRTYARFSYNAHDFSRLAHHNFCQSSEINRAAGDIERNFAPMSEELINTPEFQHLLSSFAHYIDVDLTHRIIDVHQIRVTCNDHTTSSAAPEGIHQDGFEFVGIYCVQRKNICGGFTQLFTSPVDQHPHLNTVLEESQFIIINDRHFYHFISETLASTHDEQGVRDVFVFTA